MLKRGYRDPASPYTIPETPESRAEDERRAREAEAWWSRSSDGKTVTDKPRFLAPTAGWIAFNQDGEVIESVPGTDGISCIWRGDYTRDAARAIDRYDRFERLETGAKLWAGSCGAAEVMEPIEKAQPMSKLDLACTELVEILEGEPVASADATAEVQDRCQCSDRTVRRAAQELNVTVTVAHTFPRRTLWSLQSGLVDVIYVRQKPVASDAEVDGEIIADRYNQTIADLITQSDISNEPDRVRIGNTPKPYHDEDGDKDLDDEVSDDDLSTKRDQTAGSSLKSQSPKRSKPARGRHPRNPCTVSFQDGLSSRTSVAPALNLNFRKDTLTFTVEGNGRASYFRSATVNLPTGHGTRTYLDRQYPAWRRTLK